jgi:pullulanase-type alpha-1,6-glucosidase
MILNRVLFAKALVILFAMLTASPVLLASDTPDPTSVTVAGSLQSELGCPGDWQPDCAATHLAFDADDLVWQGIFNVPTGNWEYKAPLNDSWDENYGEGGVRDGPNILLNLGAPTDVKFYYDHETHWITDNENSRIATAVGSFQDELGCPGDWQPDCLRSWLQDLDGDGTYTFSTTAIPAGSYEAKVAIDESWDESYGDGGGGDNIPFDVPDGATVHFFFESATNIPDIVVEAEPPSDSVAIVGNLQSELGCPGDWQPECPATELVFDAGDDVWQAIFAVPAGSWEYKAALNDSWAESYPDFNILLDLGADTDVKFYYDDKSHWVTDNVNSVIATAVGSFQDEMGCPGDWQPDCLRSWLQDPDGDGTYSFTTDQIPPGSYEAKVTINESWDENYGEGGVPDGPNIPFSVPADTTILFEYDSITHILTIGTPPAAQFAIVHYYRGDGDYGDHTTGDYNDYWGLHLWGDGIDPSEQTDWTSPKPFLGEDEYGRFAWIRLAPSGEPVNFIVHRGDVKDGTDADRSFIPGATPEIWLKQDDGSEYSSQATAQGYATIRYHRDDGDYGDYTSDDFNDFWGLHLWGEAIDPTEGTDWTSPKKADGIDDYGAFWTVLLQNPSAELNFIIHRGDEKDPGPDESFTPNQIPTAWKQSGDEEIYPQRGAAEGYATLHYHRPAEDYGDYTSPDFIDFWGMHVWDGAETPTAWPDPVRPSELDIFGPVFEVPLVPGATELAYILHRGDEKDPGPDQFLNLLVDGYEVWQLQGADPASPYILPVPGSTPANPGNLRKQRAYWVDERTVAWEVAEDPGNTYTLHYSPDASLTATETGIIGGDYIVLGPGTLSDEVKAKFPHLAGLPALEIQAGDLALVPEILRGQFAVSAVNGDGDSVDATGLQIPGVLDDLYTYEGPLGTEISGGSTTLRLWAPTAQTASLLLFDDSNPASVPVSMPMALDPSTGVWNVSGGPDWVGKFYLFEVEVFAPTTNQIETNAVTDPYSLSLAANSARSQIVDLSDPALQPPGWNAVAKPPLPAPEDVVVYELHVRDFSWYDPIVPDAERGTFRAFTEDGSYGMDHLSALADAGLTHLHLLPVFDIATVTEYRSDQVEPDEADLASYPPDSDQQQAIITAIEDQDGFNWGYDPFHFTTPEGGYSTDPDGAQRILEFREMVQSLNETGLRVVMDVVYNHTNSAGQNAKSVLDKLVPGYYHRLNADGLVETSSCCPNTAAEHAMMEKLMIDSIVTWARDYKVDGFRFDLMGHHPKSTMLKIREALDALTPGSDGVVGSEVYLYGEAWNFGEVANDARFVQATQANMGGTGIGSFNDRVRDGVRGGGPFSGLQDQGFATGLFYDPNATDQGSPAEQEDRLKMLGDWIRVSLAGGLANFPLIDRFGNPVLGWQIDYNGQQAGYTLDPQEIINYAAAHDNETFHDAVQLKVPVPTPTSDRVRVQNVANDLIGLGQGVPFFHAGQDMLRSKSMDRDSYNSGDWFNRLDFTYSWNAWGSGLPVASKNLDNWPLMAPLLANPALQVSTDEIQFAAEHFREMMKIRKSSRLFRLPDEASVINRVRFLNTGPAQIPGMIVMVLGDDDGSIDVLRERIAVLFNATDDPQDLAAPSLAGYPFALHEVQQSSADPVVGSSSWNDATSTFSVPARTTAVFVAKRSVADQIDLLIEGIEALVDAGVLNGGQGNALISKLLNALAKFENGQTKAAANQLGAFINQVEDFVEDGILSADQGAALIAAAEDIIGTIPG